MHLIQILSLVLPLNLKLYSEAFKHLRVISQKKKKKKKKKNIYGQNQIIKVLTCT